ncbi:RNase E inhibitor protein [Candidatus Sodalis pierantonius str. SOPE]|uniref:Regulator of ribonuclease activity B n=2 Tax=Sodalis TaxID=84565 RepID=W0I2V3_9GAMM|nr:MULTISPECIES: ribonuclease E inhibitor RraB [Sodalis]AHF74014.1 RNase E inhibitor protein [Candidatus Sodalis pierantonius str. SOPE]AHF78800.1 Ribonuclease E inhibitor [Sodalis praecaptivus]OIV46412.1 ribonuclease E inhibitor B [Sodalis sp. TME1]
MAHSFLEEQREETRLIIDELLEDGSDPEALYTIEHHLSADNFDTLEKVAVEAFKLGYEVTDAEELEVEGGETLMCCDAVSEVALQAELIDAQVEQLFTLAQRLGVNYDGWGTYFEDPDGEDEEGDEFDQDEDDDPADSDEVPATRH